MKEGSGAAIFIEEYCVNKIDALIIHTTNKKHYTEVNKNSAYQ
jgi:hypothetical protein